MRVATVLLTTCCWLGDDSHMGNRVPHVRRVPSIAMQLPSDARPTPESDAAASFGQLPIPEALAVRLHDCGFTYPMEIQREAIPRIESGENVVIHAATGSGKVGTTNSTRPEQASHYCPWGPRCAWIDSCILRLVCPCVLAVLSRMCVSAPPASDTRLFGATAITSHS